MRRKPSVSAWGVVALWMGLAPLIATCATKSDGGSARRVIVSSARPARVVLAPEGPSDSVLVIRVASIANPSGESFVVRVAVMPRPGGVPVEVGAFVPYPASLPGLFRVVVPDRVRRRVERERGLEVVLRLTSVVPRRALREVTLRVDSIGWGMKR